MKALRIFHILKCASITTMTYFRHQNNILQPAVDLIWVNHQSSLLQSIAAQNSYFFLEMVGLTALVTVLNLGPIL